MVQPRACGELSRSGPARERLLQQKKLRTQNRGKCLVRKIHEVPINTIWIGAVTGTNDRELASKRCTRR
jgi:hypothetical protein